MFLPARRYRNPDWTGWYVDMPRDLVQKFSELYPGRSNKKKFTIAFVAWAIRVRPDLDMLTKRWVEEPTNQNRQLRAEHAPDLPVEVLATDQEQLDDQT